MDTTPPPPWCIPRSLPAPTHGVSHYHHTRIFSSSQSEHNEAHLNHHPATMWRAHATHMPSLHHITQKRGSDAPSRWSFTHDASSFWEFQFQFGCINSNCNWNSQKREPHSYQDMMWGADKVTVSIPAFDLFPHLGLHPFAYSLAPIHAHAWNYSRGAINASVWLG
jgi:hypothetical protein